MNERKKGIVLTYVILALNIVIGLFYTPFMLSKLGDSQYGIYSLATSLISFLSLLDLGFGQSMVRYVSKARATNDRALEKSLNGLFLILYTVVAVIALGIGIVLLTVYPRICRDTLSLQEMQQFRMVFGILLVNVVVSFPMSIFSAMIHSYERFFFLKAIRLLTIILKYGSMLLLLIAGFGVVTIALVTTITSVLMQAIYAVYSFRKLQTAFAFGNYDRKLLREIFWFSFFIFINILVDFLYSNTDKLILGAVKGTFAVTVYSLGIYFQTYYTELSTAISGVFMPQIVKLYENGRQMKKISDIFIKVGRIQMMLLVLILSGFITYGKEFIFLWVGEGYTDAYIIGCLIMIPSIIPLTQNIGISILRAMNLHKYRSYMYLAIAFANVMISIPLAQAYGGIGAAAGTCLANIAGQILFMNWFYWRKIGLDIGTYWKHVLEMALLAFVMIGAGTMVKRWLVPDTVPLFLVSILGFGLLYMVLYGILLADHYEKQLVKDLFARAWKK